jgi:hypothetical protein
VYSQTDITNYPKTKVVNGDTVTLFHISQTKKIIKEGYQLDFLQEKSTLDSLIIYNQELRIGVLNKKLEVINSYNDNLKNQIVLKDDIIGTKEEIIISYRRKDKFNKLKNGLIIGGLSISIPIIIILLK